MPYSKSEAREKSLKILEITSETTFSPNIFFFLIFILDILYINFAFLIDCLIEWHKSVIVDYLSYNFPTRFSPEVRGRFY